jgi:hypothetical protein
MKGVIPTCLLIATAVNAFVPTCQSSFQRISTFPPQVLHLTAGSSSPDYTDTEREDTRDLIISLSLESTDHDRRMRLKELFHEALARPNGMPKRFTDLFDVTLAEVGDEIQREAKKKFFEAQAAEQAKAKSSDEASDDADVDVVDDENDKDGGEDLDLKTPDELQLWALVDMMVQSKTIVKKQSGDLGSKGNFQ